MPYRRNSDVPSGTGALVTFRTYLDPMHAKLDAARLAGEGIESHIFGEGLHNVITVGSVTGVRLQVRRGDLDRAASILDEPPDDAPRDDGEETGVIRCPRCELAYCFHERMRLEGSSGATALAFFAAPLMLFLPKRWHCHKCGHVWDDPKEGPVEMTRLADDDPTPVFRLRRAHGGMGLFLGLLLGFLGAAAATALAIALFGNGAFAGIIALIFFFGVPVLGWLVGRAWTYDVCSVATCRTRILGDREDCPGCKGVISGVIHAADEHYAAAADVRRELAAMHEKGALPPKKKKKKRRAAS